MQGLFNLQITQKTRIMEHLKFPVGRFSMPSAFSASELRDNMSILRSMPDELEALVGSMDPKQLENAYRPEGWTARQVIHHICDSHTHALIRFKWSLSEDEPIIKPYREGDYARLYDYAMPVEPSLVMIRAVHEKLLYLMEHMTEEEWGRGFHHPESKRHFRLYEVAALYAWHCRHHLAHIKLCL